MMTLKLQIVIAIAILAILAVLVNMIRKRSLELKYALVWMMVLAEMLRERMVASSRVKPGRGIAANSSSTKWTWRGRAPWWIWSAL